MAQKTVVMLEDDLDGGTADRTVRFALDGVDYEIDLSDANAARLSEILREYAEAARRVGAAPSARRTLSSGPPPKADPEQLQAIRSWARARGYPVKDRGRIPRHIVDQYNSGSAEPAPVAEVTPAAPRKTRAKAVAKAAPAVAEVAEVAEVEAAPEKVGTPRKAVDLRFSGA